MKLVELKENSLKQSERIQERHNNATGRAGNGMIGRHMHFLDRVAVWE